jgi:ABC-type bacteriocin/lantibiotic exporter with double-glycine peptidase domain
MYQAVPSTMQMQAADCGAASLKMILDFYKCFYTLEEVRNLIGVGNDGSTIGDIRQAARKVGLVLEASELSLDDLHSKQVPCILWWDHVHFVVYEGTKSGKEIINDPAIGRRHLITEEFIAAWTGVAILINDTNGLFKHRSTTLVSSKDIIAFLTQGAAFPVALGLLFNTLGIVPAIVLSQLTSYFTDQVIILNQLSVAKTLLWSFLALTGASALLSASSYYLTNRADYIVGIKRSIAFFDFILDLPLSWFADRNPQEIATRLVLPSKMVSTLTYSMVSSFSTILKSVLILLFIFAINIPLGILFLLVFISTVFVTLYINNVTQDNNQALSVENGKQQSTALGTLMNLENIRSVGEENLQFSTWAGYYTNYTNFQQKISVSQSYASLASFSGTYLFTTVLVIVAPILIIKGQISIGDFIGLQFLVGYLSSGTSIIPSLLTQYQSITSPVTRLRDAFEGISKSNHHSLDPTLSLKSQTITNPSDSFQHVLDNIDFAYRPGKSLITSLSFQFDSDKLYCLSGKSGSGLTTTLKLLSGLLTPQSGSASLLLNSTKLPIVPGLVRYISDDPIILDSHFADNISLMNQDYSIKEIISACKESNLFDYVKQYPKGIFSSIPAHGKGLSSLVLKRLLIARILLNQFSFTVVDDFLDDLPKDDALTFVNMLKNRKIGSVVLCNRPEYKAMFDNFLQLN